MSASARCEGCPSHRHYAGGLLPEAMPGHVCCLWLRPEACRGPGLKMFTDHGGYFVVAPTRERAVEICANACKGMTVEEFMLMGSYTDAHWYEVNPDDWFTVGVGERAETRTVREWTMRRGEGVFAVLCRW